jgi:uncharacterized protein (DUF305 family)
MRRITRLFLGVMAVAGMANCGSAMAQSSDAGTKYYRLDFEVKEVDLGKVVTSRSYSTLVSTEARPGHDGGSIRAGTRIPINLSPDSKEPNIQYMDVGVNIDCSAVRMTNGQLSMAVTAEVSTLAVEPSRDQADQPMRMQSRPEGDGPPKGGAGTAAPAPPGAGMAAPAPPRGEPQGMPMPPLGTRLLSLHTPAIRQNRWMAVATVTPGKQITLFASDDVPTKRKMEVDMTATEIH